MAPGKHSEYSPSGLASKISCPGKHIATKGMDSGSSPAAERGTECHEWAEELILNWSCEVPNFTEDWQEQCTRDMVTHALDIYEELSLIDEDTELKLEQSVNLGWLGNKAFDLSQVYGTCDVVMFSPLTGELVILDYKTGKGIEVDPERNVQMMIYALGARGLFSADKIKKIRIVVSQPRIQEEPKVWTLDSPKELVMWAHETLAPALEAMSKPDAPRVPGESQCRWCAVAANCEAQRDEMLNMLDTSPSPAEEDDISILNGLLLRHKEFKQWLNQLEGRAMGLMEEGKALPDFKLVRGRGTRKWKDAEEAEKFLRGQKLKEKERYTYKLLSPPQAEKHPEIKKKLANTPRTSNRFYSLIEKTEGKITWSLKSDKREEVLITPAVDLIIDIDSI